MWGRRLAAFGLGRNPWLTDRRFIALFVVGTLTSVVRWLEMLVFGIYVYAETRSATITAAMTLLRVLPLALFGVFGGRSRTASTAGGSCNGGSSGCACCRRASRRSRGRAGSRYGTSGWPHSSRGPSGSPTSRSAGPSSARWSGGRSSAGRWGSTPSPTTAPGCWGPSSGGPCSRPSGSPGPSSSRPCSTPFAGSRSRWSASRPRVRRPARATSGGASRRGSATCAATAASPGSSRSPWCSTSGRSP